MVIIIAFPETGNSGGVSWLRRIQYSELEMIVGTQPLGEDEFPASTPLRFGERSDNLHLVLQRRPTVAFCPTCGTQIADGASCPKCAGAAAQVASVSTTAPAAGGLADNVAGALAYVTIIPAILFLVLEPFNKKRFVRFHSFQCLFFAAAWIVLEIGLAFLGHIPFLGWATLVLWPLIGLAGFVIWLILVIKAYQGQMFKLPVIGDLAEQQAGT
jgi:uncharacterized membrane protein